MGHLQQLGHRIQGRHLADRREEADGIRLHSDYLGDRATQFIDDSAGAPWFMEVATAAPHPPYDPQKKYEGADVGTFKGNDAVSETDKSDKPGYIKDAKE